MSKQHLHLVIWKPSDRKKWLIVEHDRISIPRGEFWLAGDLSLYIPTLMLPVDTGLYLCDATIRFYESHGFGTDCRIWLHSVKQITPGLSELCK